MNAIGDSPVRTEDIDLATRIFGPDLGTLKGKTTRRKPLPQVADRITVPPELYANRKKLELCFDLMFVNSMPFFTSISRALFYRTATFIPNQEKDTLFAYLDHVLRLYNSNGFQISDLYCDNQFQPIFDEIKDNFKSIDFHFSPSQAHVPEAERNNCVLKERIRAT